MAYYLDFFSSANYVQPTSVINLADGDSVSIKYVGYTTAATHYLCDGDNATNRLYCVFTSTSILINTALCTGTLNGSPIVSGTTPVPLDGADYEIILTATSTAKLGVIGGRYNLQAGQFYNAGLKSVVVTKSSVITNNYDPSATGGTGSILEDTVGTNDGTLVNFPTDDSQWVFYSDTTAIELTPTTINSNSQSFNPLIQYASLLALSPIVVDSASSSLNPVIQYSASLNIFPNTVDSSSISLNPIVKYIAALDLLPGAINSNSVSLDPIVNYTSILNISPSVVNSNSVSFNPSINYTSALILSPSAVDSSSVSLDPLVEYKAVINITSQLINSASVSLNPSISTGATQDVGLVSASFANDLYSVQYEASGVTASYQLSNITVNFKG